jgi:hypothetical protein
MTLSRRQCVGSALPLDPRCRFEPSPRAQTFTLDYGIDHATFAWRYADSPGFVGDNAFWTQPSANPAAPIIPPADGYPECTDTARFGTGTCLRGRVWIHGDTLVGQDAAHATAPDGTDVGFHGPELANHYFSLAPDQTFTKAGGGVTFKYPFFLWRTLPDPPPWSWNVYREGAAVAIVRDPAGLAAVFEDGLHQPMGSAIDPALAAKIMDPALVWLTAVEASPHAGNDALPMALALSADATSFVAFAAERAGTLTGDVALPGDTLARSSVATASGPPARSGFAGVYSRPRKTVFVLGGASGAGDALDDLWMFEFDRPGWTKTKLPPGVLGPIESAVYSYRDKRLWVLDTEPGKRDHTRVLRVEVETGAYEIVVDALGKRPPKYDLRGLTVDMDGRVLFYASSTSEENHRIASIAVAPDGYALGRTALRHRALAVQPIVDLRGVQLFYTKSTRQDGGPPNAAPDPDRFRRAGERLPSLTFDAATAPQIAELLR